MLRFIGLFIIGVFSILSASLGAVAQEGETWDVAFFQDDAEATTEFIRELPANCKLELNFLGSSEGVSSILYFACPEKESRDNWDVIYFDDTQIEESVNFIRGLPIKCDMTLAYLSDGITYYGTLVAYACPGGSDI